MRSEASKIKGYQQQRETVSKGILRATRIARRLGAPVDMQSCPAPAVSGVIIPVNVFQAILFDPSYDPVGSQLINDALSQTIGECEVRVKREFWRLINPFYWIKEIIAYVLRIPFMIVQASGFEVSRVEDHFIAKVFKLLEFFVILYILIRLGVDKEQLKEILIKLFPK